MRRDLERELRSHLQPEAEQHEQNGLSLEDSLYVAQQTFGNTTLVKEDVRECGDGHGGNRKYPFAGQLPKRQAGISVAKYRTCIHMGPFPESRRQFHLTS